MNKSYTVSFLAGVAVGVLAAVFLPNAVRPYAPSWIQGSTIAVQGSVTAKQKKTEVLLLTVSTPEGAMLATFKRKVDEINLLVNEQDRIEIAVPEYSPFVDDPKIIRVMKEQRQAAGQPAAEKPKEEAPKEVKTKKQDAPSVPAATAKPTGTHSK